MGIVVSAAEAGALVGRHERMVRWHIQRGDLPARKGARRQWQINTDDLTRVPGWVVDRERLARLELRHSRSYSGMVARVEQLESRMRGLETQIRALEARLMSVALSGSMRRAETPEPPQEPDAAFSEHMRAVDDRLSAVPEAPAAYRGPSTVRLQDRGPDAPQTFDTRADAARWLERHGVNAHTPKDWPGWRHVEPTPAATLAFALQRQRESAGNWRVTWRLRRCADPACVCRELLPLAPSDDPEPAPRWELTGAMGQ